MPAELVRAEGLTRHFGTRVAVDDLSFAVAPGEIVSLLGPNGAGKTTTFRMLAGLIPPTRGSVLLAGVTLSPATAASLRARVGLLTEAPGLWDSLTVADNLIVYARLHGVSQPGVRVTEALEMVGLTDRATDRAGALSKGLKQRVALARAILHQPALVLLDEPTAGLDPASARHVRDLIAGLRREGRAVLVSTHNLSEAEALSDRIAVLQTRLIACDTPARLRAAGGAARLTIELERDAQAFAGDARAAGLDVDRVEAGVLSGTLSDAHLTADIVTALVGAGARIRRVDPARQSLEEVYLSLVRDAEDVS